MELGTFNDASEANNNNLFLFTIKKKGKCNTLCIIMLTHIQLFANNL